MMCTVLAAPGESLRPVMWRTFASLLAIFVIVGASAAVAGQAGNDPTTVIRPAWVIDATGQPPRAGMAIVIRGGRIARIDSRDRIGEVPGARVIDLPGETLLPGLIDTHSHLVLRYADGGVLGLQAQREAPPNAQMLTVVRTARVQLLCGVTTLRQTGEPNFNDILLRDAIGAGTQVGPRIIASGPHITNTGSHNAGSSGVDGAENIRAAVRRNFQRGAEWIKLTQLDATPESGQMAFDDIKAAADEAHRLGLKVTVHATGRWGSAIRTAVKAGVDNIEHARPLTPEIVKLMLEHGTSASLTPYVYIGWRPTPQTWRMMDDGVASGQEWVAYLAKEFEAYRRAHPQQETVDRAYEDNEPGRASRDLFQAVRTVQQQYLHAWKAGLPFSLGSDGFYGVMTLQIEFLVEAGIPPMAAIQSATSVAARLVGYGDRIGTIEPGKFADLISVEGNPIDDIRALRRIRLIMKDGVRYDGLSWR